MFNILKHIQQEGDIMSIKWPKEFDTQLFKNHAIFIVHDKILETHFSPPSSFTCSITYPGQFFYRSLSHLTQAAITWRGFHTSHIAQIMVEGAYIIRD